VQTYNLLIVDDSIWIREGLTQTINWDSFGVNIVGAAEDGYEALKIIACNKVDIVISDIRMDYFDGLTLSRKIKEKYPSIQVIIISGYDDFEYAREALRYGVSDYILKPIEEEVVIKAVKKCIEIITEKENNKKKDDKIENHFKKSMPFLREEFLRSILSGNMYSDEEIKDEIDTLNLTITNECIQVFVVKIKGQLSTSLSLYEICKKELKDIKNIEIIEFKIDEVVIIASEDEKKQNDFYKQIYVILNSICNYVSEKYNQSITIAVGKSYTEYSKIYLSYKDALDSLTSDISTGGRQVINEAVTYIKSNYSIDLSLDNVAEHVLLNPTYLSTLFKEEMNISFSKYLIYIRLEEAKKLLKNSNLKVYEVSDLVGYPNYRYFSRLFKKIEGCTPLGYRENK